MTERVQEGMSGWDCVFLKSDTKPFLDVFSQYELFDNHDWLMTCNNMLYDGLNPIGYALTRKKYDYFEFFLQIGGLSQLHV